MQLVLGMPVVAGIVADAPVIVTALIVTRSVHGTFFHVCRQEDDGNTSYTIPAIHRFGVEPLTDTMARLVEMVTGISAFQWYEEIAMTPVFLYDQMVPSYIVTFLVESFAYLRPQNSYYDIIYTGDYISRRVQMSIHMPEVLDDMILGLLDAQPTREEREAAAERLMAIKNGF